MADTQIPILIPAPLLEQLNAEAKRSSRSRSAVMRSAMRAGLEAQAGKAPCCERCAEVAAELRRVLELLGGAS